MTDPSAVPGPAVLRAGELPVSRSGDLVLRRIVAGGPGGAAWQVSLLDVERPGELPALAGAERVLTVVEGELLVLELGGREQALERHRPFRAPADAAAGTTLPTGPVRALEVLAARDAVRAHVVVLELSKKRPHPVLADQLAVLLSGRAVVTAAGTAAQLGVHDTVRGAEPGTPELTGRGLLAVVSLDPLARA